MSEEKALVPVLQKQVIFYDDELTAVLVEVKNQEEVYVPVRPICDYLGLNWSGQYQRIQRDPVLSEMIRGVCVTQTPAQGGTQEMLCLPLKVLPGWLFGVSSNRVKLELREKIVRYQRECYDVLWDAFQEGRLTTTGDATFDELLQKSDSEAVEAYRMLQAMVKLARNQILIEARLGVYGDRLDGYEKRLETVESVLGDTGRYVMPDQAMQISQAVKTIAIALGKQTKKNEFGAVYGELYRKFGITGYKMLPAKRFEEAMNFLTSWHEELTSELPF